MKNNAMQQLGWCMNDTSIHDVMITPPERLFRSEKGKRRLGAKHVQELNLWT